MAVRGSVEPETPQYMGAQGKAEFPRVGSPKPPFYHVLYFGGIRPKVVIPRGIFLYCSLSNG